MNIHKFCGVNHPQKFYLLLAERTPNDWTLELGLGHFDFLEVVINVSHRCSERRAVDYRIEGSKRGESYRMEALSGRFG